MSDGSFAVPDAAPPVRSWHRFAASCRLADIQFGLLALAIAVYGGFSSPTPDGFGWAEAAVALLLILAVGMRRAGMALAPQRRMPSLRFAGWMLLVYGLSVPVAGGIVRGHDAGLIIRDVIPFLFWLMPLFLAPLLMQRPSYAPVMTVCAGLAGAVFALRLLVPSFAAHHHVGFSTLPDNDPLYLANAPTVLFTAMMALVLAARAMRRISVASVAAAAVYSLVGLACILAMAAVMQRASLGLGAVCLAGLWTGLFVRAPGWALRALAPVSLAGLLLYPQFIALAGHLAAKNALVGFNNRPQEAAMVLGMVGQRWSSVLFGLGWGQTIASPAVGDVTVNYTHTMATALWLKTGLAGLTLAGLYIAGLGLCLWRVFWAYPALGLAIAAPVLIDLTLYANYKSFDFGLMLTLIPLWASVAGRLRYPDGVVYAGKSPFGNRRPAL
jgi:hypothetical protein